MGFQYLIPEFCPTCKILRKGDKSFEDPKKMGEEDVVCYTIAHMCTKCFEHVNGRPFGSITEEYERDREEFLKKQKEGDQS
jgi:hypothetical protein